MLRHLPTEGIAGKDYRRSYGGSGSFGLFTERHIKGLIRLASCLRHELS